MTPKPNSQLMDAIELYQLLVRAAALTSVSSQKVLEITREWIMDPSTGADDVERNALCSLIEWNMRDPA